VKVDMAEGSAEMVAEANDGRSPPEGPGEIGSGGRENLTTNAQSNEKVRVWWRRKHVDHVVAALP
jgi:hypothetical protein